MRHGRGLHGGFQRQHQYPERHDTGRLRRGPAGQRQGRKAGGMMSRLNSLARSEDGTSIIEMGFAAPILSLLLIGMVDMSRGYSAKLQLEQVAQRTIEKVQNSDYAETATYKSGLQSEAATAAGVSTSAVTVSSWLECNNSSAKLSFGASCPNEDDPFGRYVEITILKTYTPMFKTKFGGANADGTYTLEGTAGVRVQ